MANQVCNKTDTVGDDQHKHVCPNCKTCFAHGDDDQLVEDFDELHTCPVCGEEDVTKKVMDDAEIEKQLRKRDEDPLFEALRHLEKILGSRRT